MERQTYTVELDWAGDESPLGFAKRYGLEVELLQEESPGGGWPLYAFTGTIYDLRRMCRDYAGDDADGDDLLLSSIENV